MVSVFLKNTADIENGGASGPGNSFSGALYLP
jgi:hypothetical protein